MNIECTKQQGITTIALKDLRLDAVNAMDFKSFVSDFIDKGEGNLILDISKLTFMDSTGLSVLIFIEKQMRFHDRKWVILGACCSILDLFELTRMDQVFIIAFDMSEAKKAFKLRFSEKCLWHA